ELGAAVGAGDELGAAPRFGGAVVGVLADEAHRAEADDNGLGSGEFLVRLAVALVFGNVALELRQWKDRHEMGSASGPLIGANESPARRKCERQPSRVVAGGSFVCPRHGPAPRRGSNADDGNNIRGAGRGDAKTSPPKAAAMAPG